MERVAGALSGARMDFLPLVNYDDVPLSSKARSRRTVGQPGARYMYSNEGYILLGCIIQQVTGKPHEVVDNSGADFNPLGMDSAFFSRAEVENYDDVATLYQLTAEGQRLALRSPFRELNAHSGIVTNVLDLSRYVRMYMRGGELDGGRILQPESVEALHTPRIATSNGAQIITVSLWLRFSRPA